MHIFPFSQQLQISHSDTDYRISKHPFQNEISLIESFSLQTLRSSRSSDGQLFGGTEEEGKWKGEKFHRCSSEIRKVSRGYSYFIRGFVTFELSGVEDVDKMQKNSKESP